MTSLVKKVPSQNPELKRMEKRINELENLTTSISMQLRDESSKRANLEENSLTNQTGNQTQIQTLKDTITQLGNLVNDSIEEIKMKSKNDFNEQYLKLQSYIDNKIKFINDLEKNNLNDNINKKKFDDVNSKIFNLNNEFQLNIKNIRDELNSNISKIDFFEKKLIDNINNIKEEIQILNKEIIDIKNEIRAFKSFKDNSNNNFRMIKGDILKQEELITTFTNKVSLMLNEFEEKISKYDNLIIEQSEKYNSIKDDIMSKFTIQDNKLSSKLLELNDIIQEYHTSQCNEINNFEEHILKEEEKFNKFIQDKLILENENIKKMLSYYDDDYNNLKVKIENLEQNHDVMKNKFFNNLCDVEEFFKNKYDSLFSLINTQNFLKNNNESFNLTTFTSQTINNTCNKC
jgi:DNA repair exonuclease SbcCD ATPase subunit